MNYPSDSDKQVARNILRITTLDEETRLKLARTFDPTIKNVHDGAYEAAQEYEASVIQPPGHRPEPKRKLVTVRFADGNYEVIETRGGEYVRTAYSTRAKKDSA